MNCSWVRACIARIDQPELRAVNRVAVDAADSSSPSSESIVLGVWSVRCVTFGVCFQSQLRRLSGGVAYI